MYRVLGSGARECLSGHGHGHAGKLWRRQGGGRTLSRGRRRGGDAEGRWLAGWLICWWCFCCVGKEDGVRGFGGGGVGGGRGKVSKRPV